MPGEHALLEGVMKLEPGHRLFRQDGHSEVKRWSDMAYDSDEGPSPDEWAEQVHENFVRTTRRQMVSDVPLGAFLSGGLDSSSIQIEP